MSFIQREINLIVNSNPDTGANPIGTDGSKFSLNLGGAGINVPKNAENITVSVETASIWWTIANIKTGINDTIYIHGPTASNPAIDADYEVVIQSGLYDLTQLQQAIERELENQGALSTDDPLINLTPDEATNRVEIKLNYNTVTVDFTQAQTFKNILGYNSQIIGPSAIVPFTKLADNVAQFNTVNHFLIHSDLVDNGIRFNKDYNQTIAQVLIDVPVGSQIVYSPYNPPKIGVSELRTRSNINFWLTDENNLPVDTNSEFWGCRVSIRYLEWISAPR